jgi:hypothetical protein
MEQSRTLEQGQPDENATRIGSSATTTSKDTTMNYYTESQRKEHPSYALSALQLDRAIRMSSAATVRQFNHCAARLPRRPILTPPLWMPKRVEGSVHKAGSRRDLQ